MFTLFFSAGVEFSMFDNTDATIIMSSFAYRPTDLHLSDFPTPIRLPISL